ncbi:DNA polymerase V [Hyphopichia burtonii NRRL Y-1933]|uniref:DNA polymerase V n=1 Tax=Hyphopichia burtonii NRRL Y-1933 TaxID=984485 RepID=A0A1E4RTF8_9ASCO|nr:DNA polymerase V [Hyphopichia burtonii NRRL Y-1933]ODV70552.1 DNA polymerase V [Hyphopichia burtonii NRRL Y-1933]
MSVLRDHYYKLASELPKERIEAATALVSELTKADKKEEWDYALNRLIKGLTTTRQSARFGFSMALTEVVRELVYKKDSGLTLSSYLDQVLKASETKASMKGKEERAVLFGRLFGLQVLVNSQLLFDDSVSSDILLKDFVNALIDLSGSKSWLRETAIFTLCQFIQLYLKTTTDSYDLLKQILQRINDIGINFTTEGIAVYLSIPKDIRGELANRIQNPKSNWKNGDPFSKGNLPLLAKALKEVDIPTDPEENEDGSKKNKKQKGNWQPRIPFVWDLIVANFVKADEVSDESEEIESLKKRKKSSKSHSKKQKLDITEVVSLKEFWKVVIDESLFSDKSSHERKFWGFEIFAKFVSALQSSQVQYLFTPNFMRCLINQSAQSNRLLNKISTKTLNILLDVAKKDYTKAPEILSRLVDESLGGCWNFDLITKSKITDTLVTILGFVDNDKVNDSEVEHVLISIKKLLLDKFEKAVESQEGDEESMKKPNDNVQKWVLDKLLGLFKNSKKFEMLDSKWLDDIFKFLIRNSFFKSSHQKNISGNIRKLSQDRLNSFLSDTLSSTKSKSYTSFCIKYINKLEKSDEYQLSLEFDDELINVKSECHELLSSIKELNKMTKLESRKDQLKCFELLFSMVLIQLYMGDDETVTVLGELRGCYESVFVESLENIDVDPAIVLTEVILSFVSRKSLLLKKLSLIVWETFLCSKNDDGTEKLNEECLKLLFDVLVTKENKEGQQKLFEGEDEFKEDDEDDEDEDDEDEDDEDEDKDESESHDSDDEDQGSEEDNDETNGESKQSEVDQQTQLKLAQALGIPTESSGEVKFDDIDSFGDDDGSSYESDSMDDEQMMAMDDQLAKIFKDRREAMSNISSGNKRKQEVMEAKEQMIFFKNRILDLLESFSKINSESYLNLSMIKPIVILIDLTLDKNLGVKAHKLLKTRLSKTKLSKDAFKISFDTEAKQTHYKESLLQSIEFFQSRAAEKNSNLAHSLACSQACITFSKNLVNLDPDYLNKVIDSYSQSLKNWASNPRNKIQASLFFDFVNWLNSKRTDRSE